MAVLIDGKAVSAKVKAQVAQETEELKANGVCPGLAVVIVGDDPASRIYVNNKKKACASSRPFGKGDCTKMPWISFRLFRASIKSNSSSWVVSPGRACSSE